MVAGLTPEVPPIPKNKFLCKKRNKSNITHHTGPTSQDGQCVHKLFISSYSACRPEHVSPVTKPRCLRNVYCCPRNEESSPVTGRISFQLTANESFQCVFEDRNYFVNTLRTVLSNHCSGFRSGISLVVAVYVKLFNLI